MSGAERGTITDEMLDNAADQVFAVLGELKGGAMKLGQALSVAEAGVPPRFAEHFREALVRLQQEAPPMPVADTHRMLDLQLGTAWRRRFTEFDDKPIAAASIGQVHRAIWHDPSLRGRPAILRATRGRRRTEDPGLGMDGRLTRPRGPAAQRSTGRLARCALAGDYVAMEKVLREEGFVKPNASIEMDPIRRRVTTPEQAAS